ncbi:hypothetical protein Daus18300_001851 [Diaporthe australafricana]|uniref:Uncharacterized protein n=1 Tax=Diaporthe australafricana TaxID=127596 RepID=A0ABR3XTD8_9PEZI
MSLPGADTSRPNLPAHTSSIIANPTTRGRYSTVHALLLIWDDEDDVVVRQSVDELRSVLDRHYHYMVEIDAIPSDEPTSSWRWLSRRLDRFMGENDQRDVLKIFFYNGRTQLNAERAMVLTSSTQTEQPCMIRWQHIQQYFEEAIADTLLIMDARYFARVPVPKRRIGMLEIIAAGSFEEHSSPIVRCAFTQILYEKLRTLAARMRPFSAADLHLGLSSEYPNIAQELNPERELISNFPAPLLVQAAASNLVPSIPLAPLGRSTLPSIESGSSPNGSSSSPGDQISVTVQLENVPDGDAWGDWLRLMPECIKEVRIEGRFRPALR